MSAHLKVSPPAAAFCAAAGGVCLFLTLFWSTQWTLGSGAVRLGVAVCLAALAGLSLLLLFRHGFRGRALLLFLAPVGLAMFLRAACMDYVSYDFRDFLSVWAAFFRGNGGFAAIRQDVGDYNVPYLYFMAAISYLPVPALYAIKLFSIFFDVVLAWGGLRLAEVLAPGQDGKKAAAFLALLLLPTVVLNGSYWAQCDALYGALVLHALACALGKRPAGSVVLLAVAFSFKLQTIFLLPLWGAFWLCRRVAFRHLWLFPLTYLATAVPALLLGKPLGDILGVYVQQAGQYTNKLAFNAPTIYALLPGSVEFPPETMDLLAKLGILAAFLLCLLVLFLLVLHREALTGSVWMAAALVLAVGVPYLLPYMHERYFFLADVIAAVWACTQLRRFPLAALVEVGSLASYAVYLRLKYNWICYAFGQYWVMAGESLVMLCALCAAVWTFFRLLSRPE